MLQIYLNLIELKFNNSIFNLTLKEINNSSILIKSINNHRLFYILKSQMIPFKIELNYSFLNRI